MNLIMAAKDSHLPGVFENKFERIGQRHQKEGKRINVSNVSMYQNMKK